jgi:hypothetical protein
MSKQVPRRTSWPVALGACLFTALLGAGCSNSSGTDSAPKIEESPTIQESTKGGPRIKGKQPAPPAPDQRRTGRPG